MDDSNPAKSGWNKVREVARLRHLSLRTEQSYLHWIRRFWLFHKKQKLTTLDAESIREFLSHLAIHQHISGSTQNQAFSALIFLYRDVLKMELPHIQGVERARRKPRLPVVFTSEEAKTVLRLLSGTNKIIASLLYGSGLRILECLRLRVKDMDFARLQILIREGKGAKDRITMLPKSIVAPLTRHLMKVKLLHEEDLAEGYGEVFLPDALDRKYPEAPKSWAWQYIFPATQRSIDPRSGKMRRHHASEASSASCGKSGNQKSGYLTACFLSHIPA